MRKALVVVVGAARPAVLVGHLAELSARGFDVTVVTPKRQAARFADAGVALVTIKSRKATAPEVVARIALSKPKVVEHALTADLIVAADDRALLTVWQLARVNRTAVARYGMAPALRVLDDVPRRTSAQVRRDRLRHRVRGLRRVAVTQARRVVRRGRT
ncbi:MAG: hypothetical protein Q7T56_18835 [Nocardioidaceae bacterium]|nr:hypothetical protein [Nocardioidaceae bacterium]